MWGRPDYDCEGPKHVTDSSRRFVLLECSTNRLNKELHPQTTNDLPSPTSKGSRNGASREHFTAAGFLQSRVGSLRVVGEQIPVHGSGPRFTRG